MSWLTAIGASSSHCLMTNHVHFVMEPERADSLAVAFHHAHGRHAQYLNVRRNRTGHLWQNRFFSSLLGKSHLWVAIGHYPYIHNNRKRDRR
jgi:putative transposase